MRKILYIIEQNFPHFRLNSFQNNNDRSQNPPYTHTYKGKGTYIPQPPYFAKYNAESYAYKEYAKEIFFYITKSHYTNFPALYLYNMPIQKC